MSLERKKELLTTIEKVAAGNVSSHVDSSISLKEEAIGEFVINVLVHYVSVDEANPSLMNVSYSADQS